MFNKRSSPSCLCREQRGVWGDRSPPLESALLSRWQKALQLRLAVFFLRTCPAPVPCPDLPRKRWCLVPSTDAPWNSEWACVPAMGPEVPRHWALEARRWARVPGKREHLGVLCPACQKSPVAWLWSPQIQGAMRHDVTVAKRLPLRARLGLLARLSCFLWYFGSPLPPSPARP